MRCRQGARTIALLTGAALMLAGATACNVHDGNSPRVTSVRTQTASFTTSRAPILEIENSNGAVRLRGVEGQSDVRVEASLRSRGTSLDEAKRRVDRMIIHMEQDQDRIVLRYVASEQEIDVRRYGDVAFDITCPRVAALRVVASNGAIDVSGADGPIRLDTANGRVSVREFAGEITAETSNGEITVEDGEGIVRLKTTNGRIRVEDVIGLIDAATSNGDVTFSGELSPGSHRFVTQNGGILLRVPETAAIRFVGRTRNGRISSILPLVGDTIGTAWDALLNPPVAATVEADTQNGSIEIGSAR